MNLKKKLVATGVAFGLAIGAAVATVPAANADVTVNGYSAVGSDTLQDVMNALTNGSALSGSNVRVTANGSNVGSFDAFGSSVIQTKAFGPYFPRPGGSGAGVNALIASIQNVAYSGSAPIGNQVDIARSSGAAGTNADTSGDLVYVPFGRDALGYIYLVDPAWSAADKSAFASLTAAQLTAIYNGTQTTVGGQTVHPRLPQTASGTRQTFLTKIGFASSATPSTVPAADNTTGGPAENDARVLTTPGEIIPFSAAQWISQFNGAAAVNTTGTANVSYGSADGVAPFTLASGKLTPNQTYYNSNWGRDVFLVVEYAKVTPLLPGTNNANPRYDAKLAALVNPTGAGQSSLVTSGAAPTSPGGLKRVFGFLAPSSTTPTRAYPNVYPDSVWPGN
jgi:hypothetical protein